MGVVYYTLAQDGEALNYFQKAYKMCLENKLKVGREILVLNGIAGIFFKQNDIGKAKNLWKELTGSHWTTTSRVR